MAECRNKLTAKFGCTQCSIDSMIIALFCFIQFLVACVVSIWTTSMRQDNLFDTGTMVWLPQILLSDLAKFRFKSTRAKTQANTTKPQQCGIHLWYAEGQCRLILLVPDSKIHGANMGPTCPVGPRWAPCWPHELCYLGCHTFPIAELNWPLRIIQILECARLVLKSSQSPRNVASCLVACKISTRQERYTSNIAFRNL